MTWRELIGTEIAGRYTLRALLYESRQQSEFLAAAPDAGGELVSVVLVEAEPSEIEQELAAIARAGQLRHPNLLHIVEGGRCVVENTPVLFVVTEAAESTLAAALAGGPLSDPAALLEDLLAALGWLHAQGFVYRNLNPETVVHAGGQWKLADLSRLHEIGKFGPCGRAGGAAPPEAESGDILPAWDVWALGALLQEAAARQPAAWPAALDAIVRGCREPDYGKRISIADIRELLRPAPAAAVKREEAPRRHWRAALAAAAAGAILCAAVVARLHRERSVARPVAAPAANQAAPKPAQPAIPAEAKPPAPLAKPAVSAAAEQVGRADFFGDDLDGHLTASGERFSNQAMSAAHRSFAMGTQLRVTNLENGRSVVVRVNDRGPRRRGFLISVTRRAASRLGFIKAGWARVRIEAIE